MPNFPFGPLSCTVNGVSGAPGQRCLIYDTGQVGEDLSSAGVTMSVSMTGYSGQAWSLEVVWYSATNAHLRTDGPGTLYIASSPYTFTTTAPAGAQRALVNFIGAPDAGQTSTGTGNGTIFGSLGYCAYGTEPKAGVPDIVYLLPALLTAIVGAITDGWAWPLASVFAGHAMDITVLCANQQPTAAPITESDLLALVDWGDPVAAVAAYNKCWTWLRAAAWQYFCQCTPGGPPGPVTPPAPGPTSVTGSQPSPVVLCDGGDPCAALAAIQATVNAIFQQLNSQSQLVTLIQRQKVPFAYVPGILHTGLTGAGQLSVQGILALSVQLTTVPATQDILIADPNVLFDVGYISTGTVDGWRRSTRLSHNPMFVTVEPDDTLVGYSFAPGVVANILELVREP